MPTKDASIYYQGIKYNFETIYYYSELINKILRRICKNRSCIVGLMIPRSVWQVYCILGTLKSGNVYVPINVSLPQNRIEYILNHSEAQLLLIDKKIYEKLTIFSNFEIISSLNNNIWILQRKNSAFISEMELSQLAYIIYTSGTTGVPKGVAIRKESLYNLQSAFKRKIGCRENETIVSLADYSFDMFIPEGILSLSYGMTVILSDTKDIINPRKIIKTLMEYCPEYIQITPSALRLIYFVEKDFECFRSLKALLVGAESFPKELFETLKAKFTGEIYNLYGPTESTVWCTCARLTNENEIHIGKELDGCEIKILKHEGIEANENEIGEIVIFGIQIAAGYWKGEKENKEKFINFAGNIGYRSGDIGYRDHTGNIHFVGRIDDQVKLHGYRVELLEIENTMKKDPYIINAAIGIKGEGISQRLIAFLMIKEGFEQKKFIQFLKDQLPPYAIPSKLIYVSEMEYNINGKTDRKKMTEIYA